MLTLNQGIWAVSVLSVSMLTHHLLLPPSELYKRVLLLNIVWWDLLLNITFLRCIRVIACAYIIHLFPLKSDIPPYRTDPTLLTQPPVRGLLDCFLVNCSFSRLHFLLHYYLKGARIGHRLSTSQKEGEGPGIQDAFKIGRREGKGYLTCPICHLI